MLPTLVRVPSGPLTTKVISFILTVALLAFPFWAAWVSNGWVHHPESLYWTRFLAAIAFAAVELTLALLWLMLPSGLFHRLVDGKVWRAHLAGVILGVLVVVALAPSLIAAILSIADLITGQHLYLR